MTADRTHRRHALKVAGVATAIVMAGYVVAALVLNLAVTDHLISAADARLADRLVDAQRQNLTLPQGQNETASTDLDDAPMFLWSVAPSGRVTALTPNAPALPAGVRGQTPVTLDVRTSSFRFDSLRTGDTLLVAGQSLTGATNVRSTLYLAELLFGALLAVAVFTGATVVGLRASAPSELVRRRQADFTADASHELRTPIAVIEAEVQLALDRRRPPDEYRHALERIGAEGDRLKEIVEDLLWLARADDEPSAGDTEQITDVADVAEACAQRFRALAATHDVEIEARREGDGPFTVQATLALIDRLAGALIDNACKFAGQAGMGGRVEISTRAAGGRVHIRVDDSGPGIPEDQREAVLDRFHRATDAPGGTGLGLAIADSVVRQTHGEWEIGDADLGGARLEVSWRRSLARRGRTSRSAEGLSESLR